MGPKYSLGTASLWNSAMHLCPWRQSGANFDTDSERMMSRAGKQAELLSRTRDAVPSPDGTHCIDANSTPFEISMSVTNVYFNKGTEKQEAVGSN